jgi:hypothetical protein
MYIEDELVTCKLLRNVGMQRIHLRAGAHEHALMSYFSVDPLHSPHASFTWRAQFVYLDSNVTIATSLRPYD